MGMLNKVMDSGYSNRLMLMEVENFLWDVSGRMATKHLGGQVWEQIM